MALFSFSVKREKLLDHTKTGTCRIIHDERTHLMRSRAEVWSIWWKSRTKDKEHFYDVRPERTRRIGFFKRHFSAGGDRDMGYGIIFTDDATFATPEQEREIYTRDGFGTLTELVKTLYLLHGDDVFKKDFGNYLWYPPTKK